MRSLVPDARPHARPDARIGARVVRGLLLAVLLLGSSAARAEVSAERVRASVDEVLADPRFQRARPDGSFDVPDEIPDEPFELPDFAPRSFEPSEASGVSEALLWMLLGVFGVALVAVMAREGVRFARRRGKKKQRGVTGDDLGRAEIAAQRLPASLARARALAREGRFEEAIHVLLEGALGYLHALTDFSLEPAFTSREVLARAPLESTTRGAFKDLVMTVEVSLFGGLPVDRADFERCERSFEVVHRHLGASGGEGDDVRA